MSDEQQIEEANETFASVYGSGQPAEKGVWLNAEEAASIRALVAKHAASWHRTSNPAAISCGVGADSHQREGCEVCDALAALDTDDAPASSPSSSGSVPPVETEQP